MSQASIISINISKGGIPKLPIEHVRVTVNGLEGDGHNHAKHCTPNQAVCLQDQEKLDEINQLGYKIAPGDAGENLTIQGLKVNSLPIGTRLEFSSGVVLEISKVRNPCYVMDAIHQNLKTDALGRHGMYAKVLQEGTLRVGDYVESILPVTNPVS